MHKRGISREITIPAQKKQKAFDAGPIESRGEGPPQSAFVPRTELGRRLWSIRQRILAAKEPLLDWDGIDRELRERSGEASGEV